MALIQAAPAQEVSGTTAFLVQMFPFLLIFLIMWFLILRPQQRRVKDHQAAIAAIQKGDEVVTGGGIRGRVTKVSDDEAEVEIASNVRVRIVKSTISHVISSKSKPAND